MSTNKPKSSEICFSSADLIGGNEDLIREILSHLPAGSLIRFKTVCKQWHSLISDPQFGLTHTLKNPSSRIPLGLLFNTSIPKTHSINFVSLPKFGGKISSFLDPVVLCVNTSNFLQQFRMEIVQSCNGLILCKTSDRDKTIYCVRNLATKQSKLLPMPKVDYDGRIVTCTLAFDPLVSPYYKVFGFVLFKECYIRKHLIFSSETGQWKNTLATYRIDWPIEGAKGVYCNGKFYWVERDVGALYNGFKCFHFNTEAENSRLFKMPLPFFPRKNQYYRPLWYFGEFNGHLHFVCVPDVAAEEFNVWEWDQIILMWLIKYRVDINHLISPFGEVVAGRHNKYKLPFSIMTVVREQKDEESALIISISGKVISYNFMSKKVVVLSEFPLAIFCNSMSQKVEVLSDLPLEDIMKDFEYASAYPFVASLYPL